MWVRIPLETYIFILNFSLPPRSEQVNGAVANEIKHVPSPEVIVVLDPRYDLSYKALYISTCSIALRDFYLDLYTILNRIYFTIWTICAFRVLNPQQWSLATQSSFKVKKSDAPKLSNQDKAKRDGVITPQHYNFSQFNTENFDALKTLRINRSRP